MDILSFILGLQKGKSMGGGSSADVRYVTFVGADGTVLYKKPVAVGDDCVDVAAKGLISTPTKESTVSQTFTYSGWSLTDGGAASSSALKNVTEDRTVYAAFAANVRSYTVRFINGDTVLQTQQIKYGENAVYTGEKPTPDDDSLMFTGWLPNGINITADTDCYAQYITRVGLDALSWAEISAISDEGTGANYFAVGDTKEVALKGTVGTLTLDTTYYVYIIGFNHNSEFEGNGIHFGTFKTADGKDICLVDGRYSNINNTGAKFFTMNHWGSYNYGGWSGCDLRYDILGSTDIAPSGYGSIVTTSRIGNNPSDTCATVPVTNTLMAALPTDLRAVMKPMAKYTNNTGAQGNTEEKVTASIDYLPLLAEFEVFGQRTYANSYEQNRQKQYEYFATGNSTFKYKHSDVGSTGVWRFRSPGVGNSAFCQATSNTNLVFAAEAYSSLGMAPIFKV